MCANNLIKILEVSFKFYPKKILQKICPARISHKFSKNFFKSSHFQFSENFKTVSSKFPKNSPLPLGTNVPFQNIVNIFFKFLLQILLSKFLHYFTSKFHE